MADANKVPSFMEAEILDTDNGNYFVRFIGQNTDRFMYTKPGGEVLKMATAEEWEYATETLGKEKFSSVVEYPFSGLGIQWNGDKPKFADPVFSISATDYNGQGESTEILPEMLLLAKVGDSWAVDAGNSHRDSTVFEELSVAEIGNDGKMTLLLDRTKVGGYPNYEYSGERQQFEYDPKTLSLQEVEISQEHKLPKPVVVLAAYDYNDQGERVEIFAHEIESAKVGDGWNAGSGSSHRECVIRDNLQVLEIQDGGKVLLVNSHEEVGGYPNFEKTTGEKYLEFDPVSKVLTPVEVSAEKIATLKENLAKIQQVDIETTASIESVDTASQAVQNEGKGTQEKQVRNRR